MTAQSAAEIRPLQRPTIVALMVTRRCNMTCAHCSVESGPNIKDEPSLEELRAWVTAIADSGAHLLLLTGGEPMLRQGDVLAVIRHARHAGLNVTMSTNGFWGSTPVEAERTVRALRRAGLLTLTISPDRYHAPFQSLEHSLNIARAAKAQRIPLNVNLTRAGNDKDLDRVVTAFDESPAIRDHVRVRFFDVQPVGRARGLHRLRSENDGACIACRLPAVTDDGRVTACNGPSYFAPEGSPLNLGSLAAHSLAELLDKHASDPILDTIRTHGVKRLREELEQIPGVEPFPFRSHYSGMCDLCTHLTADPQAVAVLRARLSGEQFVAERLAKKVVVQAQRREGPRHYFSVNSTDRARVFWPVVRGGPWPEETTRVLGRADFDWKRSLDYLSGCGLAKPLAARLDDRELTRWAPPFFIERMRTRATRDALREFIIRETVGRLDEALGELDVNGVLLKSAALLARATAGEAIRAGSDVDLWVPPDRAAEVREFLLTRGFDGPSHARRTAAHHLAPIMSRGVLVELHTRLLPAFFGLPEDDMLNHRTSLRGCSRLATLDAEATLLHAVVHCTSHLFAHGFKTAWDIAQCRRSEDFDWERLQGWVAAMDIPRAFWTPFNALRRELAIHVPSRFSDQPLRDAKQLRLETIARRRIFSASEAAEEVNPFSKNAVFVMMCDSPVTRARVLFSLFRRDAAEARTSNWEYMAEQSATPLTTELRTQLFEAWRQWRDYRQVIASRQFHDAAERVLSPTSGAHA
jgi:MoaA/NifB/PqqE/SkfB family radical SAM enzyme